MNLGDLISKGNSGSVLLLRFPHKEASERSERRELLGRELGPNCLFRFLPHIANLPIGTYANRPVSDLGDILRPKQYIRHKYQTYKSTFSYEELLENLRTVIEDNITVDKQLLFFGSSAETFPIIFNQLEQLRPDKKKTILVFSPYLNLQSHYNGVNIRIESSIRWIVEKCRIGCDLEIHFVGVDKRMIHKDETDLLNEFKDVLKVTYMQDMTKEGVIAFINNTKETGRELFVSFSFDVVSSQYFGGKNFDVWNPVFDNYFCLDLIDAIATYDDLRAFAFYDFNPQIEDYASGVFYATLVYDFLRKSCKFSRI